MTWLASARTSQRIGRLVSQHIAQAPDRKGITVNQPPSLEAALSTVRSQVALAAGEEVELPAERLDLTGSRIGELAARFGLSPFESDVVLLAALPALEPDGATLIAKAQGDPRLRLPTVALALSALRDSHWSAFAAEAPLRARGLIEVTEEPVASARCLVLPERVLHHLVGLDGLDAELIAVATVRPPLMMLAGSQLEVAAALAERFGAASPDAAAPILQLLGSDRAVACGLAAAAAGMAGRRACLIDPDSWPASGPDRARLARLWSRETRLTGVVPVIDAHEASGPTELRVLMRLAAAISGPVIVLTAEPLACPWRATTRIDVPRLRADEQVLSWTEALGSLAPRLEGAVARLVAHFTAAPDVVAAVAAAAKRAASDASGDDARLARLMWEETRIRSRPRLDELAQRVETRAGWNDIVLPGRQLDMLKAIAAQVRQRTQVYESWGFGAGARRGLGINALFAGPSGTGKTLAAEVIGGALDLDVYRIDLSAVVSKWIGETEKNLKRVFDAAEDTSAILLFDEADALFGKRADVKDSHDRYANIEVSYLLQRMETYRGLAILTTNLRSHIDQAFLRRLRFVVEFPFPGEVERQSIWRLSFPHAAPREGMDFDRLAQLNVAGGSIRNIAFNAAFIAADAAVPIGMIHVQAAARAEYEKLGKPLTAGELRGWIADAAIG